MGQGMTQIAMGLTTTGLECSAPPNRAEDAAPVTADAARNSVNDPSLQNLFQIIRWKGRFFAIPRVMLPVYLGDARFRQHKSVLSADTRELLVAKILACDPTRIFPVLLETRGKFRLFSHAGQFHAIPHDLTEGDILRKPVVEDAAILTSDDLGQLQAQLDVREAVSEIESRGELGGFRLYATAGQIYAVPPHLDADVDLFTHPEVLRSGDEQALIEQITRLQKVVDVEYAGWLPAFRAFGNCGSHPQFAHVDVPPEGYRFVRSDRPLIEFVQGKQWKKHLLLLSRGLRILATGTRLFADMLRRGMRLRSAIRFLQSRNIWSQLLLPTNRKLSILTSVPFTYSQSPWVVEIEDPTTLFYPFIHNGQTSRLNIQEAACFQGVKALLESPNCRGLITHIRGTADGIPKLFQSEIITKKTFHIPMGVQAPDQWQRHEPSKTFRLLFTNSWHQSAAGFYLRGGLDLLEAYALLKPSHPEMKLILRTKLPQNLPARYRRIIDTCDVEILDEFLPKDELDALMRSCHAYVLPSARIHIISILQAMSYGLVPVVSDGWGTEEYVAHRRNGLVVKGRYGKTSWQDPRCGMLREDYAPLYKSDPAIVQGLVDSLSALVEDPALRRTLGQAARHDVETRFSLASWNDGLKQAFDRALAAD